MRKSFIGFLCPQAARRRSPHKTPLLQRAVMPTGRSPSSSTPPRTRFMRFSRMIALRALSRMSRGIARSCTRGDTRESGGTTGRGMISHGPSVISPSRRNGCRGRKSTAMLFEGISTRSSIRSENSWMGRSIGRRSSWRGSDRQGIGVGGYPRWLRKTLKWTRHNTFSIY